MMRRVNTAPDMAADEKRQLMDSMYYKAVQVARLGNKVFEDLK
jgi:hypothetical protein